MSLGQGLASKYYSGFNPLNIEGCVLWLDAADTASFTMSGTNLAIWNDKSTNKYVCTPISGTSITQSTQNGRNVFYFNRTRAQISNFVWTNDSTIFMVTNSPQPAVLYSHWTTGYTNYVLNYNWDLFYVGSAVSYRDSVNPAGTPIQTANTWGTFSIGYDSTARVVTNYAVNGTTRTAIRVNGTAPGAGSTTATLFINGNGNPGSDPIYVSEIFHFNRSITTPERQQIEAYLGWKWGIRTFMPTSHPYYSITPVMRPFTPLDIPGCSLWLDAADLGTLTVGSGRVSQWADKSGLRNDASQNTFALQPSYSTNGVSFERGRSTAMALPNATVWSSNNPLSIFFVITPQTTYAANVYLFQGIVTGNVATDNAIGLYTTGTGYSDYWQGTPSSTWGSMTVGVTDVTSYVYSGGGSNLTAYTNGISNYSRVPGNYTVSNGPAFLGAEPGRSLYSSCDIREVIIYQTATTNVQRQQVEGYLAQKWGLRTNLPVSHPLRNVIPAITSFNPRHITGCALWLDAADPSTLTLSGFNVSQWNDKSGSGFNLSQSTAGNRPTYSNGVVNFLASSSNSLSTTVANGFGATASVFAVLRMDASSTFTRALGIANGNTYISLETGIAGAAFYNSSSGRYSSFTQFLPTTGFRHIRMVQRNGATVPRYTVNGGTITNMETGDIVIGPTPSISVGTGSSGFGATAFMTGHIAEIIAYTTYLTDAQIRQMEGYLARKWGLQPNLPSSHAYKKISPI